MKILRKKIGGIYRFPSGTTNEQIIEHVLHDFGLKLFRILEDYYDPKIGCSSLCTYKIFRKRWEIVDPGDVSSNGDLIYNEIPSSQVTEIIQSFPGGDKYDEETVRRSFGGGEFPIIKIWKGYHPGRQEIHVTYQILR